jgi:DNA-binding MarR family transcriptional regulator
MTLCACEALRRTTRAVTALYQDSLRESGVRATQLPILVAAHLAGPVPISTLADALVMDRTTLTRNLKGLQRDDLVTLEPDEDRRVRLVVLTDKGRAALESAVEEWRRAHDQLVGLFGPERIGGLVAELAALTRVTRI